MVRSHNSTPRSRAVAAARACIGHAIPAPCLTCSTQSRSSCDLSPWMERHGQPSTRSSRVRVSQRRFELQKIRSFEPSISSSAKVGVEHGPIKRCGVRPNYDVWRGGGIMSQSAP